MTAKKADFAKKGQTLSKFGRNSSKWPYFRLFFGRFGQKNRKIFNAPEKATYPPYRLANLAYFTVHIVPSAFEAR